MQKSNGLSFQASCARDCESSSKGSSPWDGSKATSQVFLPQTYQCKPVCVCVYMCVYVAQSDFFFFNFSLLPQKIQLY